jgi:threonyl-tRNA synthetase
MKSLAIKSGMELQKIPFLLVVGEKEFLKRKSCRQRKEGDKGTMTVDQFIEMTAPLEALIAKSLLKTKPLFKKVGFYKFIF